MKILLSGMIFLVFLGGCTAISGDPGVGSKAWYDQRILEIDQAYAKADITKEEQLTLRNEVDQLRLMYQRDVDRQLRWGNFFYSRPVYDCNGGVCTQISP